MLSRDVCLSVRPSLCPAHAGVVSKRLNVSSDVTFFTIGYHTILVFAHQTLWQYSNGGVECRGMKKSRFSTGFISEIVQDDLQWPQGCSIIWRWISETVPDIHSCNEILKGTYTRPTHRCHFKWPWIQWHEAPCDLSASCRYRFLLQYFQVIWRWRMPIPWNLG